MPGQEGSGHGLEALRTLRVLAHAGPRTPASPRGARHGLEARVRPASCTPCDPCKEARNGLEALSTAPFRPRPNPRQNRPPGGAEAAGHEAALAATVGGCG